MAPPTVQAEYRGWRGPLGRFSPFQHPQLERLLVDTRELLLHVAREETPIAAREHTPPGEDPGNLRQRWVVRLQQRGHDGSLELQNTARYYKWIVGGRGPIVAKRRRYLRFFVRGRWLFRRRVGATRPNPFDQRIVARVRGQIREPLRRYVGVLRAQFLGKAG
jgi:hypothetical protein